MSDAAKPELELGYWDIRGLAAPLRMLCEYAAVPYTDTQYTIPERDAWFKVRKPELVKHNALVTLPYVVDTRGSEQIVISQSNACLLYLGRRLGLAGSTPLEVALNEQCLCEVFDLRNAVVGVVYPRHGSDEAGFPEALKRHWKAASGHLNKLEAFLDHNDKRFASSDAPLSADFHLWEMLDQHERMKDVIGEESLLITRPRLGAFYKAFRELPQLKGYFEGAKYSLPMNNTMAYCK